jgi:hypothetical protein
MEVRSSGTVSVILPIPTNGAKKKRPKGSGERNGLEVEQKDEPMSILHQSRRPDQSGEDRSGEPTLQV